MLGALQYPNVFAYTDRYVVVFLIVGVIGGIRLAEFSVISQKIVHKLFSVVVKLFVVLVR